MDSNTTNIVMDIFIILTEDIRKKITPGLENVQKSVRIKKENSRILIPDKF